MTKSRRAHCQHARRRPERLELESLTQEVKRLVALSRAAGMKLEILAHLARRVREIRAALEENRRRHAAGREHDHLRANLEAVASSPREGSHHLPYDGPGLSPLRDHRLYLNTRPHTRAGAERRGHVGDVHALLRATPAAGEAFAAAPTAAHISGDGLARVAEGIAASLEEQIARALDILKGRRDPEELLDGLVVRAQPRKRRVGKRELRAPALESKIR